MKRMLDTDDKKLEERLYQLSGEFSGDADDTIFKIREIVNSMNVTGNNTIDNEDIAIINNWSNFSAVEELYNVFYKIRANERLRKMIDGSVRATIVAKDKAANINGTPLITDRKTVMRNARDDAKKTSQKSPPIYHWD
jgi:hypothetical protein